MSHDHVNSELPAGDLCSSSDSGPQLADDGYRLAPENEQSQEGFAAQGEGHKKVKLPLSDDEKERAQRKRRRSWVSFSLWELIVTTTFIAVGLAGVSWLPPGVFAGLSGLLALAFLIFLNRLTEPSRGLLLVGWTVIIVYISAAVMSVAIQWR